MSDQLRERFATPRIATRRAQFHSFDLRCTMMQGSSDELRVDTEDRPKNPADLVTALGKYPESRRDRDQRNEIERALLRALWRRESLPQADRSSCARRDDLVAGLGSFCAMPKAEPRLPPVTITLCIVPHQLSGRRDVELGYESDRAVPCARQIRRDTRGGFALTSCVRSPRRPAWLRAQHHVGDDDRARDGFLRNARATCARPDDD